MPKFAFEPSPMRPARHEPMRGIARIGCRCDFRSNCVPDEIGVCGCGYWWRVGRRGRWRAISKRKAFKLLWPVIEKELDCWVTTGNWWGR